MERSPGRALLMSLVLREWPRLLPLAAALAVAEVAGEATTIKWPNDVLLDGRKVAGILVEGRSQEGWMVLGIGLNVALRPDDFPPELRDTAATLGRDPARSSPPSTSSWAHFDGWLAVPRDDVVTAFRARDALAGREVSWADGQRRGRGDRRRRAAARRAPATSLVALDAGEVHLAL